MCGVMKPSDIRNEQIVDTGVMKVRAISKHVQKMRLKWYVQIMTKQE